MRDFKKLLVWEKAHHLALDVYKVTSKFPKDELYGITSQMRRSSSSVPTNIAEGAGRGTDGDMARFLQIAGGSAAELEYQLLLARDLGFLDIIEYGKLEPRVTEVKRMISSFIDKLKSQS